MTILNESLSPLQASALPPFGEPLPGLAGSGLPGLSHRLLRRDAPEAPAPAPEAPVEGAPAPAPEAAPVEAPRKGGLFGGIGDFAKGAINFGHDRVKLRAEQAGNLAKGTAGFTLGAFNGIMDVHQKVLDGVKGGVNGMAGKVGVESKPLFGGAKPAAPVAAAVEGAVEAAVEAAPAPAPAQ